MAKLPPNVKTVSWIAAGFGLVQSCVWLVLGSLALSSYLDCNWSPDDEELVSSTNIAHMMQKYFFLNEYCPQVRILPESGGVGGVVSAYEMHVWAAVTIAGAGVWLIASCCVLFFVTEDNVENVNVALYSWSVVTFVVSCVDIALGAVLGVTYEAIGNLMTEVPEGELELDLIELQTLRFGSIALMILALRGFVLVLLNLTFTILFVYYAYLVNASLNRNEHNIHSIGPIHAYQGSKRQAEPWNNMGFEYDNYDRSLQIPGGQLHRSISRTESDAWQPPVTRRPHDDSYGRSFDRSDSWHQGKVSNLPPPSRPFNYLEEPQQAYKPPPPRSPGPQAVQPAPLPPWKRATTSPPELPGLPAPDYSPTLSRQPRLKSALKTTTN